MSFFPPRSSPGEALLDMEMKTWPRPSRASSVWRSCENRPGIPSALKRSPRHGIAPPWLHAPSFSFRLDTPSALLDRALARRVRDDGLGADARDDAATHRLRVFESLRFDLSLLPRSRGRHRRHGRLVRLHDVFSPVRNDEHDEGDKEERQRDAQGSYGSLHEVSIRN